VINSRTFADLDGAIDLARECGASEFLLLPEERWMERVASIRKPLSALQEWVAKYRGDSSTSDQ